MSDATDRSIVIAGNWKMNLGPVETHAYLRAFGKADLPEDRTIIIFPPAISLPAARDALSRKTEIRLGVQNIHWEENGAFTGETSARMAAGAGATYALCGHSERRKLFGETDEAVGKKASAADRHGMTPIICIGETIEQRKKGEVEEVLLRQLTAALAGIRAEVQFLLAYEPVWAIGTGNTATPEDAATAHKFIREQLAVLRDDDVAQQTSILYGGSVKPENASLLLGSENVDGLLVGGASTEVESFVRICGAEPIAPSPTE